MWRTLSFPTAQAGLASCSEARVPAANQDFLNGSCAPHGCWARTEWIGNEKSVSHRLAHCLTGFRRGWAFSRHNLAEAVGGAVLPCCHVCQGQPPQGKKMCSAGRPLTTARRPKGSRRPVRPEQS